MSDSIEFDKIGESNAFLGHGPLPEGAQSTVPDGTPVKPWSRVSEWKGEEFRWTPPVRAPQVPTIKREADGRIAAYPEELRLALLAEDKKNYPRLWAQTEALNPVTPEGLASNMAERDKWPDEARQKSRQLTQANAVLFRKAPGHSLSNALKKKYIHILGDDFSPSGSESADSRGARVGGSLNDPACFDDRYVRFLWDLGSQAETTIGRALYLGKLADLKKSADKVAKKVLTETQLKIYAAMFETDNLSVVAAQLSKSPSQIHAAQKTIMQKIRRALNLPEPVNPVYESKDGPEWDPFRLNMRGQTRVASEQDEESYD